MYRVASASEYLVITGVGITDIKIAKKAWVLPGQSCTICDISPVNYTFEVQAMSAEKLPFVLPAVFTIGPRVDDEASLLKYAKLISPHDKLSHHVKELVQGIIEGETRVLAASMTMEEIFRGTKEFKQEVFEKVQLELNQFGLLIYNANVKQLVDLPGHDARLPEKRKMVLITEDMIKQFQTLMEEIDEPLKKTFQNVHQGYPTETLVRFLKERDGNVSKAHKMLVDCLNWRNQNEIDDILAKPIPPTVLYRQLRDSHLMGMPGYSKEDLPVIAVGAVLSTFDKASDAFNDGLCRKLPSHLKHRTLELQDQIFLELAPLNTRLDDIQRRLRHHSAQSSQQFQSYRKIRYKKEQCSSHVDELKFQIKVEIKKTPMLKGWVCTSVEDIRAISAMNEELNLEKPFLGFYLEDNGGELTRAGVVYGVEMKIMSTWGLAGTTSDGGNVAFITREMESKWWEISRSRAMLEEGEGEGNAAMVDSAINYFLTNFEKSENLKGFLCLEICHVRILSGINSQFSKDLYCCLDLSKPNSENLRRKACMEGLELAEVVLEDDGDDEGAEEHREECIAFPNSLYFDDTYRHKKDRDDFDFGKLP